MMKENFCTFIDVLDYPDINKMMNGEDHEFLPQTIFGNFRLYFRIDEFFTLLLDTFRDFQSLSECGSDLDIVGHISANVHGFLIDSCEMVDDLDFLLEYTKKLIDICKEYQGDGFFKDFPDNGDWDYDLLVTDNDTNRYILIGVYV